MIKYVLKRIVMMIPVILGVTFIIFTIMDFTPGDPASLILGESATPESLEALRHEMGLDQPFLVRFGTYIADALHGDFGESYRTGLSVFDEIFARFPTTVRLAIVSILLAVVVGIPLGVISAVKQYSFTDNLLRMLTLVLHAVPGFWLGLMLILIFALRLSWLPATGVDSWKSFILPAVALSVGTASALVRMTRSTMLEVIRQDYIRTARAKGAPEKTVIIRHALRNALLPVITSVGMSFGAMLGGALVVESVFAMPGLGTLMINSIRMKDTPMVLASIIFVALTMSVINLVVDVLYAYIDPRIRSQYVRK